MNDERQREELNEDNMAIEIQKEESNEDKKISKKQKPGLGAVRPDDYVEDKFKEMAKERKLSQTEMFERMFWSFLSKERQEKLQKALDFSSEIHLISKDLSNILKHFESITEKAQNTVISITANAEQAQKNLQTEIDTQKKQNEEIRNRNKELEATNNAFEDVKRGLEVRLEEINDKFLLSQLELKDLSNTFKKQNEDFDVLKKDFNKLENENKKLVDEAHRLSEELKNKDSRIKSLENSNFNLSSTLNNIDEHRKAEIQAIDNKYSAIVAQLTSTIDNYNKLKDQELKEVTNQIRATMEAEKNAAVADLKVLLANTKTMYADSLLEIQKITREKEELEDAIKKLKAN